MGHHYDYDSAASLVGGIKAYLDVWNKPFVWTKTSDNSRQKVWGFEVERLPSNKISGISFGFNIIYVIHDRIHFSYYRFSIFFIFDVKVNLYREFSNIFF